MASKKITYWFLQLVTSIAFLLAGVEILIDDVFVYVFSFQTGLPVYFLHALGVATVALALIKLLPKTSFIGQLGLLVIVTGALGVDLIVKQPFYLYFPALLLLVMLLWSISLNYSLAEPVIVLEKDSYR
jgi:hypothetical protein